MSEPSSARKRPIIPSQLSDWLRVTAIIAVVLVVVSSLYLSIRREPSADEQRRQAQRELRSENTKKAQILLTEPARNADGTLRIPIKDALNLAVANPDVLGEVRTAAGTPPPAIAAPAGNSSAPLKADPEQLKRGAAVYSRTCIACHQPTGLGVPPVFPPLANAPIVVGKPELAVKFILHGLMGPITVNGITYNSMMPPVLGVNDADIADVLTYVRQSFGNQGSAVSAQEVKAIRDANSGRTTPWNTSELGLK